jgi:hypothetical protein
MTFPTYFSNFPNLKYAVSVNKAGHTNDITIKDYFRLLLPRDDIYKEDTLYTSYRVIDGERPDQIAYKEFGDEQFYWVILQINGIVDYYNEWPLSSVELEKHILKKYESWENANEIHHWETVETKNSDGNLVLPKGMYVDEDYIYYYADNDETILSSLPVPVTNYEYEERVNEEKSLIQVLNKRYIDDYMRDIRIYGKSLDKNVSSQVDIRA